MPAAGFIVTFAPEAPVVRGLLIPNLIVPVELRAVTTGNNALILAVPNPVVLESVKVVRAAKDALTFAVPAPLRVKVANDARAELIFAVAAPA